jgi:hypothetical protein
MAPSYLIHVLYLLVSLCLIPRALDVWIDHPAPPPPIVVLEAVMHRYGSGGAIEQW